MTKCIQRIRDLFVYALYKFTLYLLTYLHYKQSVVRDIIIPFAQHYFLSKLM